LKDEKREETEAEKVEGRSRKGQATRDVRRRRRE